jgi:hypothetical protein
MSEYDEIISEFDKEAEIVSQNENSETEMESINTKKDEKLRHWAEKN